MNRTRKSEAWVDPVFHNSADTSVSAATRQLPVLLHRAREALAMHFRKVFIEHDLTDPQWRVLRILNDSDEIDVAKLARRSYLMGPSLSRILRDLAARGLIVRRVSSADARRFFHALTPRGRRLLSDISPEFNPVYRDLELRLGLERIRRLNASLTELLQVVQIPPDQPEGGSARGIGRMDERSGRGPRRRSAATDR